MTLFSLVKRESGGSAFYGTVYGQDLRAVVMLELESQPSLR
jgi:hypothetical protein